MPWHHDGDNGVFLCEQREYIMANIFLTDGEDYSCAGCWRKCVFEIQDGIVTHKFTASKEEAGNEG